ncbi:MAG: hypothetical protein WKH64_18675 [Chloroflexia bacterium]
MRVALLGSTGSIGVQTLDVIARHPGRFQVVARGGSRRRPARRAKRPVQTAARLPLEGEMDGALSGNKGLSRLQYTPMWTRRRGDHRVRRLGTDLAAIITASRWRSQTKRHS